MEKAFARPFRPTELTGSTVASLSTRAMAEQLMSEATFAESGRDSLTLVHSPALTVVLVVLGEGACLKEHRAPSAVALVPLFGRLLLTVPDEPESVEFTPEVPVTFAAHVPHSVEACEDSAFLVILGGQKLSREQRV